MSAPELTKEADLLALQITIREVIAHLKRNVNNTVSFKAGQEDFFQEILDQFTTLDAVQRELDALRAAPSWCSCSYCRTKSSPERKEP